MFTVWTYLKSFSPRFRPSTKGCRGFERKGSSFFMQFSLLFFLGVDQYFNLQIFTLFFREFLSNE